MNLHARAKAAQRAARQSGEMLCNCHDFYVRQKADNDFVTEMDLKSENLIREVLLSEFPEDEFFGEESGGSRTSKGRWIVDPIDGTQTFMRGHLGYTISIAYEYEGELVIGCIYAPKFDEMYLAIRGEGATLNGNPIHVSDIQEPRMAMANLGFGHRVPENFRITMSLIPTIFSKISDVRRYGSAAYAICCVACGRSDIFFERGLFIYDIAAAKVILEEAGGRMTGWNPEEDCTVTGNILATNVYLHPFMLNEFHGC